jgi:hypothetical protein
MQTHKPGRKIKKPPDQRNGRGLSYLPTGLGGVPAGLCGGYVWEGAEKPLGKVSHGEGEDRLYGAGKGRARQCRARWEPSQPISLGCLGGSALRFRP